MPKGIQMQGQNLPGTNVQTTETQNVQDTQTQDFSHEDLNEFGSFLNEENPEINQEKDEPSAQETPQYYTAEELQQLLEQGQEIDPDRLSPEAKILYSKFLDTKPQEPDFNETVQETEFNETNSQEPQLPDDVQLQYQIIQEATNMANEAYKQIFGEEFDKLTATPEQEEMYKTFLDQAKQQVEDQVKAQIQQQRMAENDAKFIQYYAQKIGKNPVEAQKELESLFKPIIEPFLRYQQAMINGDFETAYKIFEELKAKQANVHQQKPQQPINTVETPSAPQVPVQEQKDEFQEFLEFLS